MSIYDIKMYFLSGKTFNRDVKTQALPDGITFIFSGRIFLASIAFPWIRFIFPSLTGYNGHLALISRLRELFSDAIDEHAKYLQEANPKDLIDVYLTQIKNSSNPEFSKDQLKMILFDLFGAGSDHHHLQLFVHSSYWSLILP